MTTVLGDERTPLAIERATLFQADRLARLFAAAFASDPVFDWLMRSGKARTRALQRFFAYVLRRRTIPPGETWMTEDGRAAAAWIPPYALATPPRLADDLALLPVVLRLTGLPRLPRGTAMAAAMEKIRPREPYHYLAFLGVAPRAQGEGLGAAILARTLERVDRAGGNAYLENSNPRNIALYERAGFSITSEVRARKDAPPIFAMWRAARPRQGSSTISQ